MKMTTPANEVSREKLLERDVMIQFQEIRRLREENEKLKAIVENVREWVNLHESN
jgi:hypothetical protein